MATHTTDSPSSSQETNKADKSLEMAPPINTTPKRTPRKRDLPTPSPKGTNGKNRSRKIPLPQDIPSKLAPQSMRKRKSNHYPEEDDIGPSNTPKRIKVIEVDNEGGLKESSSSSEYHLPKKRKRGKKLEEEKEGKKRKRGKDSRSPVKSTKKGSRSPVKSTKKPCPVLNIDDSEDSKGKASETTTGVSAPSTQGDSVPSLPLENPTELSQNQSQPSQTHSPAGNQTQEDGIQEKDHTQHPQYEHISDLSTPPEEPSTSQIESCPSYDFPITNTRKVQWEAKKRQIICNRNDEYSLFSNSSYSSYKEECLLVQWRNSLVLMMTVRSSYKDIIRNEIEIMEYETHPNLLTYYASGYDKWHCWMLFELVDSNLEILLKEKKEDVHWNHNGRHYAHDVAIALQFLHYKNLCHKNLHPQTVLIKGNQAKLSLLGFSSTEPSITIYTAPDPVYQLKTDVFVFGKILVHLLTQNPPHFNSPLPVSFQEALSPCFDTTIENRPTMNQFISTFPWNDMM
eukprot:TRINITY_DN16374_c0_g1_i1.p1 TRINITY_DN16374_c0_g1~~TRINITY_DN16374_c0_g1_i1.p1  ORF type:complete len:511 (+),score=116.26 TRINITY_DN16374_c0_g1_i1:46-1578(+)